MSNILRFASPNPVTDYLSDNWQSIRDEYINYRRELHNVAQPLELNLEDRTNKPQVTTLHEKRPIYDGLINAQPVLVRPEAASPADRKRIPWWREGVPIFRFPEADRLMPTLAHWVNTHEQHLASVVFYLNQPGSWIRHHYGPETNQNNFRLHLGLSTDPEAVFDLENQRYTWTDGDVMGFDDSNVYHGVKHLGTRPRLILAIDYRRTELLPYVQGYEPREFIAKSLRQPPAIVDWE